MIRIDESPRITGGVSVQGLREVTDIRDTVTGAFGTAEGTGAVCSIGIAPFFRVST